MIAVFESKEFKSTVVKYSTYLKTKYDISENDVSAFMESSQLKPFTPLLKDTKSLSSVDAVHMMKSMSFRDVVLEQCIKLLPKNISVGDVQKLSLFGNTRVRFISREGSGKLLASRCEESFGIKTS